MTGPSYRLRSRWSGGRATAHCKDAQIPLDAGLEDHDDAFNPTELLPAAVAACMTRAAQRAARCNGFEIRAIEVRLEGTRQDRPPRMARVAYERLLDVDGPEHRLDRIHRNVLRFGTVTGTIAAAAELTGRLGRMPVAEPGATGAEDRGSAGAHGQEPPRSFAP